MLLLVENQDSLQHPDTLSVSGGDDEPPPSIQYSDGSTPGSGVSSNTNKLWHRRQKAPVLPATFHGRQSHAITTPQQCQDLMAKLITVSSMNITAAAAAVASYHNDMHEHGKPAEIT